MAIVVSTAALTTSIKNTSGRTMVCSFLPPHGKTLLADETFAVIGDIWSHLKNTRKRNALLAALESGDLEITSTPAPIFIDETTGASLGLTLKGGSVEFDASFVDHSSVSDA